MSRSSRRMKWLGVVLALSLVAAGCGSGASPSSSEANSGKTTGASGEPVRGGTLTMDLYSKVSSLDPQNARTVTDLGVAAAIADPLLRYDADQQKYVGYLSDSWQVSQDGLTYTFHIRDGAKFQDGEPIDANAVKANMDRVQQDENLYTHSSLNGVTSIKVVDPQDIQFTLNAVNTSFLLNISTIPIVAPNIFKEEGDQFAKNPTPDKPFGSGPFIVESYNPDQQIVLKAYKDYWAGAPYLDSIVMRITPEQSTREIDLKSGTAQLVTTVPEKDAKSLEKAGFQLQPFGKINAARLMINLQKVTDVKVRQAMCYALGRQQILDHAYFGFGKVEDSPIYPGSWADSASVPKWTYDPEKAKQLLKEAGYTPGPDGIMQKDGKKLEFNLPSSSVEDWLLATQLIQQNLKDIGIATKITTAASQQYYTAVRTGQYDITWWLTNYDPTPPVALTDLNSSDYWNVTQMSKSDSAEVDRLLNAATSTLDQNQQAQYYQQLATLVYNNAYECPGIWFQTLNAAASNVHGVRTYPTGMWIDYHKWWMSKK